MVTATLECNNNGNRKIDIKELLNTSSGKADADKSQALLSENIAKVIKSNIQNKNNKLKTLALASVNFIGGTTEYLSDKLDSIINKIHRGISRTEGYIVPKKLHSLVYGVNEFCGKLTSGLIKATAYSATLGSPLLINVIRQEYAIKKSLKNCLNGKKNGKDLLDSATDRLNLNGLILLEDREKFIDKISGKLADELMNDISTSLKAPISNDIKERCKEVIADRLYYIMYEELQGKQFQDECTRLLSDLEKKYGVTEKALKAVIYSTLGAGIVLGLNEKIASCVCENVKNFTGAVWNHALEPLCDYIGINESLANFYHKAVTVIHNTSSSIYHWFAGTNIGDASLSDIQNNLSEGANSMGEASDLVGDTYSVNDGRKISDVLTKLYNQSVGGGDSVASLSDDGSILNSVISPENNLHLPNIPKVNELPLDSWNGLDNLSNFSEQSDVIIQNVAEPIDSSSSIINDNSVAVFDEGQSSSLIWTENNVESLHRHSCIDCHDGFRDEVNELNGTGRGAQQNVVVLNQGNYTRNYYDSVNQELNNELNNLGSNGSGNEENPILQALNEEAVANSTSEAGNPLLDKFEKLSDRGTQILDDNSDTINNALEGSKEAVSQAKEVGQDMTQEAVRKVQEVAGDVEKKGRMTRFFLKIASWFK